MFLRSEVRPEILAQPCEGCGQPVHGDEDAAISFYRGRFVIFHQRCWPDLEPTTGSDTAS